MAPLTPRRRPLSCHPRVLAWTTILQRRLPDLSKPPATVLALGSLGRVRARSCALTAVSPLLATWRHRNAGAVRQQVRECCYEATAQRGPARPAWVVETGLVPLLAGVVDQGEGTPMALALAATTLGARCTVLALSVVSRGWASPVAWPVLAATATHAWRREWLRMRRQGHRALPRSWTVLVLADRGLSARWLFRRLTRLGWHPFVRLNPGGPFRPTGPGQGVALQTLGPAPGTTGRGTGSAFTGRHRPLPCTLLACGETGYKDPWWLLTDLPPEARTAGW